MNAVGPQEQVAHAQPARHPAQLGNAHEVLHRLGHVAKAVDELLLDVHPPGFVLNHGNALVDLHAQLFLRHVTLRQEGVHGQLHAGVQFRRDLHALRLADGLLDELEVHVVAHGAHVAALLGPQHVARAADLQIAHGDAVARAELRKLPDGREALVRRFGQQLVGPNGQVGVGLPAAAPHAPADLIQLGEAEAVRVKDDQRVGLRHV